MKIRPYKTKRITPNDKLFDVLNQYLPRLNEKDVVVITSKIIAITQGRIIKNDGKVKKLDLIKKEAEYFLPEKYSNFGVHLTIKNNVIIASAGIDESNGGGYFVLWPKNIQQETNKIWDYLRKKHNVKDLGVVVTDSKLSPMRRGVTAIGLSWCGFKPLRNYVGKPDIYGKPLRFEQLNVVDCLAAAAVLEMGEAYEQTPLGVISGIGQIEFVDRYPTKNEIKEMTIELNEDIYSGVLKSVNWLKGGK